MNLNPTVGVEALLSPNSRYTGRTVQQTNFGRDYGFSVLGISRRGQTIQERPSARDSSMATLFSCSATTQTSND
jgi:K+/H+ antiporter YhaU regulatory subunit KhtT